MDRLGDLSGVPASRRGQPLTVTIWEPPAYGCVTPDSEWAATIEGDYRTELAGRRILRVESWGARRSHQADDCFDFVEITVGPA